MRYYLGVDWADQTHAVWVVDESGAKIAARAVAHTAEGLGAWGRELDEWRAQAIELSARASTRSGGHPSRSPRPDSSDWPDARRAL